MSLPGRSGRRERQRLELLGATFEGLVHLLKGWQGVPVQGPGHEGHEQSAVDLLLYQADPARIERLDVKAVLAVEDAGQQQPAEPAQPPARVSLEDGGSDYHAAAAH